MNERIKELAIKAGFGGKSMRPITGTTQEQALSKFAELIIQEYVVVRDDDDEIDDMAGPRGYWR